MTNENRDILFETRDTNIPKLLVFLAWMFGVTVISALLMFPLTKYLWSLVDQPALQNTHSAKNPAVILEVLPSQELTKMKSQISEDQDKEKINTTMATALKQGFAVRKS